MGASSSNTDPTVPNAAGPEDTTRAFPGSGRRGRRDGRDSPGDREAGNGRDARNDRDAGNGRDGRDAGNGRDGRVRREDRLRWDELDTVDQRGQRDDRPGWDRGAPAAPPPAREDWLPATDAARSRTGRFDWAEQADQADPAPPVQPRPQPGPPGYQPTQAAAWHPATELAGHPEARVPRQPGPPDSGPRYPDSQHPGPYDPGPYDPGPYDSGPQDPSAGVVRYGPGVPETAAASQAATSAERIWKTGPPPAPPRRRPPWRRALGPALTVILLGASAVVLFLRFHHAPFEVSGAAITQQTPVKCGVNVTGRIDTNGSAGTVSYQWVFQPDPHAPQPLTQTVPQGQHAVFVTVAVQGSGSGSATQKVTLQVLGPQQASAVTTVVVRC